MRFSKYNHEGYHDPTVYEAFTGIEEERKQEKQAVKHLRASYAVYRPIVYICSPYAGDVKQNVRRAQAYCRFAVQKNCVPIATHLLFPQFMDDTDPAQRQQALFMSRLLLTKCTRFGCSSKRFHRVWPRKSARPKAGIKPSATSRRTVRRYRHHARTEDRLRQQLLCQGLVE